MTECRENCSAYEAHTLAQSDPLRFHGPLTEQALKFNGDDHNTYIPYEQCLAHVGLIIEADNVRARILLASNIANTGQDPEEASHHLQTAVALRPGDPNTLYNAACCYAVLGKKAEALETLKSAFASGYGNFSWASKDTDLQSLHDEPEFRKLVGLDASS
jgi:tetratricopeptide (TPR) repeat protein